MITYKRSKNIRDRFVRAFWDPKTPEKILIAHNLPGNFKLVATSLT